MVTVTPGTACGYWNARKRPRCARSSAPSSTRFSPSKRISPSVISYAGWPIRAYASVDFPEPFGPMTACTWSRSTARSTPLTISLPVSSCETCRFLISSNAIALSLAEPPLSANASAPAAHPTLQTRYAWSHAGNRDHRTGRHPARGAARVRSRSGSPRWAARWAGECASSRTRSAARTTSPSCRRPRTTPSRPRTRPMRLSRGGSATARRRRSSSTWASCGAAVHLLGAILVAFIVTYVFHGHILDWLNRPLPDELQKPTPSARSSPSPPRSWSASGRR